MADNKTRAGIWLFAFSLTLSSLLSKGEALTIYRLGGADLAVPEVEQGNFVALSWEDIDENQLGMTEALDVQPGFIAPENTDPNVNIAPETLGVGFSLLSGTWIFPEKMMAWQIERFSNWMIDGDPSTIYQCLKGPPGKNCGRTDYTYMFNLGKQVYLNRIRFFAPEKTRLTIPRFIIGSNDGDQRLDGLRDYVPPGQAGNSFDFDILHDGAGGEFIEVNLPPTPTERVLFQVFRNLDGGSVRADWEVTEFEIYATGFAPFARYTSNVIDLGEKVNIGLLTWSGRQDPDTQVELRMRSGADNDPNVYWRNTFRGNEKVPYAASGAPLTRAQYNRLEIAELGGVTHDLDNWSAWSPAFDFADGQGRASANQPRRFVQFDIAFRSAPDAGGQLDYIQFATSPRLVTQARAEIDPAQVRADEVANFTYKLRPQLEPGDAGFDAIAIDTPALVNTDANISVRLDGVEVPSEVLRLEEHGFEVKLATPIGLENTEELLEIDFQAQIFAYDTPFTGRLSDSAAPFEVPQPVVAGDADETVDGNTLRVALSRIPQHPIQALRLSSAVFSPNGDGAHDVLRIEYELLNLSGGTPALIQIYDLSGRQVGEVRSDTQDSGLFRAEWDGRDQHGALLTPGLYVLQLKVEADKSEDRSQRLVSLVY